MSENDLNMTYPATNGLIWVETSLILEFCSSGDAPEREPRYSRLLAPQDFSAPANSLEVWWRSLATILLHVVPSAEGVQVLAGLIGSNYPEGQSPTSPFPRAVTSLTKLLLSSVSNQPLTEVPLDLPGGGDLIAAALTDLDAVVSGTEQHFRRADLVRIYWLLRVASLHGGLLMRTQQQGSTPLRECLMLVLEQSPEGAGAASDKPVPGGRVKDSVGSEPVSPIALKLKSWMADAPQPVLPTDSWTTLINTFRHPRWSVSERLRHTASGDVSRLGMRGSVRLGVLVASAVLLIVGGAVWWSSLAKTAEFERDHVDAALNRILH